MIGILCYLLFWRNLGATSLVAWDEAWYGGIAKNILATGQLFRLTFNGVNFWDHPPFALWLMAAGYQLFGISSFSTRMISAATATGCLYLLYLLGKKMANRLVGLGAAATISSFSWFWLRSRQGDLDVPLLFFLLLTTYFTWTLGKTAKRLPHLAAAIGCLMITKTLIGWFMIPLVIGFVLKQRIRPKKWTIITSLIIVLAIVLPWHIVNYQTGGWNFVQYHWVQTGLRIKKDTLHLFPQVALNLSMVVRYLRYGILRWFYPVMGAAIVGLVYIRNRYILYLYWWLAIYLIVFMLAPAPPGIWHLLPIYLPLGLVCTWVLYQICTKIGKWWQWGNGYHLAHVLYLFLVSIVFFIHVGSLYSSIVKQNGESNEAVLSRKAKEYQGELYIKDDYWPVAVFYSDRYVTRITEDNARYYSIPAVFDHSPRPFQILAKDNDFTEIDDKYEIILHKENRILIQVTE